MNKRNDVCNTFEAKIGGISILDRNKNSIRITKLFVKQLCAKGKFSRFLKKIVQRSIERLKKIEKNVKWRDVHPHPKKYGLASKKLEERRFY